MTEPGEDALIVRVGATPVRPGGRAPAPDGPGAKRAAIVRAATELFLEQGYQATRTEQIATAAAVSKQTVYNQFGDKESLFRVIVLGVTATAEAFAAEVPGHLGQVQSAADVEPALRSLARRYLGVVLTPQVLALRRLIISEAARLPGLAASYYERAPARVLAALGEQLARLHAIGLLTVPDPSQAAEDFAFLLLGRPLDEGHFRTPTALPAPEYLDRRAEHAVRVVLAAYSADGGGPVSAG